MSGKYGFNDKDIEKIAKVALSEGWRIVIARGGHVLWYAPDGVNIITSSLTGSQSGWNHHKAALRRLGLSCVQSKHHKAKQK